MFVKSPITHEAKFIRNATAIAFSHLTLVKYLTKNISITNPARITGMLAIPIATYTEGHAAFAYTVEFNRSANTKSSIHFLSVEDVLIETDSSAFYN